MGIGLGARWMIYDDSAVQESSLSEEEAEKKKKINAVYNTENQAEIKEDLERLKQEQTYTQDNMLIKYNPFGTNTQSLYVYFETENPAQISYTIHVADSSIEDFKRTCYQESEMQTQHELQVIGLIPDMENEITFTIAYEDGTVEEKQFLMRWEVFLERRRYSLVRRMERVRKHWKMDFMSSWK